MITWEFLINDVLLDDEPQGWSDLVLNITRDQEWHGVFFEAATSPLGFYGDGGDILRDLKRMQGLAATATLEIRAVCGTTTDVLTGTLDFGTYNEDCGTLCLVNIAVEKSGCTMQMRNRYDQKVDLSSNVAFDRMTVLQDYAGLNFEMDIEAQAIQAADWAEVETQYVDNILDFPDFIPGTGDDFNGWYTPSTEKLNDSSLGAFNNNGFSFVTNQGANNFPPFGADVFDFPKTVGLATIIGDIECGISDVVFSHRLNLNVTVDYTGTPDLIRMRAKLFRLPDGLEANAIPTNNWVEEYSEEFYFLSGDQNVDIDLSNSVVLANVIQGDFFAYGISILANDISDIGTFNITVKPGTFFKMQASLLCEPTTATVSLVNETGSRVVEAITNGCLRMKSDYYGRTDSQPYASTEDGCGSLRVLTSGLRLRNALNPKHFMSLQDFFRGLRGIDNIGMGVEPGEMGEWLRVEPVEYWYEDALLLTIPAVAKAKFILDSTKGYSLVKIGYTKWEVENVNGLDEFNSNKEFRTSLSTVDNTLDALSPFVAGGYPIEITRQQSFAESGGADTTYDNETFIICVERDAYGFHVEQGVVQDAADFYSPATAYNWRLRPFYNLMRWWKSIAQSYVNLANSVSKLFFASGTGNLLASGWMPGDPCELAGRSVPENEDLDLPDFTVANLPLWKPERVEFEYPFSLADYNIIKANPKGYINLQCGNGLWTKAYIISIQYKPADGMAQLNLLLRWDT